jgi:hypothetical protein
MTEVYERCRETEYTKPRKVSKRKQKRKISILFSFFVWSCGVQISLRWTKKWKETVEEGDQELPVKERLCGRISFNCAGIDLRCKGATELAKECM